MSATSKRVHVDLPVGVGRHNVDRRPRPLGHLQAGDVVARVGGPRGEDAVARLKRHRVEGHIPGPRRILQERDLLRVAAQHAGNRIVRALQLRLGFGLGLVPPDGRLPLQVPHLRVEDRLGRQGGPGIVEVKDVRGAGRLGPDAVEVDGHGEEV
jgi:hypothetical protein